MPNPKATPKNYFLNERHELPVEEKPGGGRIPEFFGVNWTQKSQKLHKSLERVERLAKASKDPLSRRHYYLVADPAAQIVKVSKAKTAKDGKKVEAVEFNGEQSKVFNRLGLDLIEVHPNGSATIHAAPERLEQLLIKAEELPRLGGRDQARWITIEEFGWIPPEFKFDQGWLDISGTKPIEVYIKLQPLISEIEADLVIRSVSQMFLAHEGAELRSVSRSYLGRFSLRTMLNRSSVKAIASEFSSIQSLHPPIIALTQSLPPEVGSGSRASTINNITTARNLPCIGVVDTAVPDAHRWLQPYRRAVVQGRDCSNTENDNHGSRVASRVVFGEMDLGASPIPPPATCSFLEVRVGTGRSDHIRVESVPSAIQGAITAAPDVRVFNLSFDAKLRLDDMLPKERMETLKQIEELDNFAFDQDVLLIVAAGNAAQGIIPTPGYPHHIDHTNWELHSVPRAFNALTCGGSIARLRAGGLASEINAPCPFTRIGPGFARSPKPDLCASAGNTDQNYNPQPGSGVWTLNALGDPSEVFGTSYSAPILAREAAFTFEELRKVCPEDTRPFACTVKAVLALTADDVGSRCSDSVKLLAKRTLGCGKASVHAFKNPVAQKARYFWQGIIQHHSDIVRTQIPIPKSWIQEAELPTLRICVSWDTPVCAAAEAQWACRDVEITLRAETEGSALRGSQSRVAGYPLFNRIWNLKDVQNITNDQWTAELKYSQLATYAAGHNVSPMQRIAIAAEIWDEAEAAVSPHTFIQSLPIASTLNRLSNTVAMLPQNVTITTDF